MANKETEDQQEPPYEIGRGRPPKETRFKPGRPTANPYGRGGDPNKRARKLWAENFEKAEKKAAVGIVAKVLADKVCVTLKGKRQHITTREFLVRIVAKAASDGDPKALDRLFRLEAQEEKARSSKTSKTPAGEVRYVPFPLLPEEEGVLLDEGDESDDGEGV